MTYLHTVMPNLQDHMQEIVDKWRSIDDEIWAKIICMERNRRIAKAYARRHTILVDGSQDDYLDGTTLGLNSFDNPDRDSKTSYMKQLIGEGVKLRIQKNGDILVKRLSEANVFVHHFKFHAHDGPVSGCLKNSQSSSDVYALNSEGGGEFYGVVGPRRQHPFDGSAPAIAATRFRVTASTGAFKNHNSTGTSSSSPSASSASSSSTSSGSPNMALAADSSATNQMDKVNALQPDRVVRIFNMAKFKEALEFEARQPVPDRVRLQSMCISILSFVCDDQKMLNLPSWIMIINIVALDLLSSEIGLVGPYDLSAIEMMPDFPGYRFHGPGTTNRMLRNKSHEKAFNCSTTDGYDQCDFDDGPYRKFNGLSSGNNASKLKNKENKNGRGCANSDNSMRLYDDVHDQNHIDDQHKASGGLKTTNSESELKTMATNFNVIGEIGSSSSGFNSNYSLQNDSSATSSSSINMAETNKEASRAVTNDERQLVAAKKVSKFRRIFKGADNGSAKQVNKDGPNLDEVQPSSCLNEVRQDGVAAKMRGERPPKLPHGLPTHEPHSLDENDDPLDSGPAVISNPIPIPAPPTSAGGSSGKANLILVSPTGLSPPSGKRSSGCNFQADMMPQEFDTIRHIDEEGRCKVLLDRANGPRPMSSSRSAPRVPTGIPSHAQLAPPATQRHILRYLMSTAKSMGNYATSAGRPPPPPLPPSRRLQRPLPILPPGHERHLRAPLPPPEESLYYSGFQARVPNYPHNHLQQQQRAAPVHPITKGAINAILTDFKQSAHFRQQQRLNRFRQQQQLVLAKLRSNSASHLSPAEQQVNKDPIGIPPIDYSLRRDQGAQSYMRSLESLNRHVDYGPPSGSSNANKPIASLFSQVGGLWKRSKAKIVDE